MKRRCDKCVTTRINDWLSVRECVFCGSVYITRAMKRPGRKPLPGQPVLTGLSLPARQEAPGTPPV